MGFLESLRQAVRGLPNGRSRSTVERLSLKVMRSYEEGRFREATEAARQLLDLQREELGEEHPDYATALSNLALLLQRQGDIEGAEPLLRQVLEARKQALGESHPDYATSLNNLGELLSLRQDLDGAEPLLHQALAVRKELLGERHPDYAVSLNSLALLRNKRGDLAGAESLLAQALDIRREMLGELHPDYAAGLSNLANLLVERGELTRAESLLRQALQIRRAAFGEHHPDAVATASNLTRLLHRRAETPRPEGASDRPDPDPDDPGDARFEGAGASRDPEADRDRDRDRMAVPAASEGPAGVEAGVSGAEAAAEELARLTELFREVGGELRAAGERMQSAGAFPDPGVFGALAVCHYRLALLGMEARGLAGAAGVPCPPDDRVDSLRDLDRLLADVARARAEGSRAQALSVLERVLRIRPRDPGDRPALERCQDNARELHRILVASAPSETPPVAEQLARGEHPFADLLRLVDERESLDSPGRAALRRGVAWAFGEPLAEGAAAARLVMAPPSTPGGEAEDGADRGER